MDWSFLAFILLGPCLLLVVLGYWQRRIFQLETERSIEEIRTAEERNTSRALTQFPQIDVASCIGCASCVTACPESGVLGVVDGIARVIHGARCIGHARCVDACPVAAITVGLGDVSGRTDLPLLSPTMETTVPGIYIAGELGGIALIRNAFEQGARAVDNIADRLGSVRSSAADDVADILIVGAGPAGLSAILKSTELGLRYVAIDQEDLGGTVLKYPRRKLTMTGSVELPLYGRMKRQEYLKEDLLELWTDVAREFDVEVSNRTKLVGVRREGGCLLAETSAGSVAARFVVLAMGRRGTPRKLGVPGEESEKVLYQLIDAATYENQHVLVVGGGDSAIEAATALANQTGNTVTLSYRKPNFFRIKPRNEERINQYVDNGRVRAIFSSNVERIEAETVALNLETGDTRSVETLRNDFVLVFAGGEPPYPLLKSVGVQFGGEQEEPAEPSRTLVEA